MTVTELPRPRTPEGRDGLTAVLREPAKALIGLDFDGTIAPVVADPEGARAHPAAVPSLISLADVVGTIAIITGRPAAKAVEYGGFAAVPGIVVLGLYGWERWQDGALSSPPAPPGIETARTLIPSLLAEAGAPEAWIEDKGHSLAVHTRRTADPQGALSRIREPLTALGERLELAVEPGRLVIELRPPGTEKGAALTALVLERAAGSVVFCGDDLGDLAAFAAVRALRSAGIPGLTVCSASPESPQVAAQADLVVDGPEGIVTLLRSLAATLGTGESRTVLAPRSAPRTGGLRTGRLADRRATGLVAC
jgi:trehalose 6-phosphate phosphatase